MSKSTKTKDESLTGFINKLRKPKDTVVYDIDGNELGVLTDGKFKINELEVSSEVREE